MVKITGQQVGLDEIFIAHSFFADKTTGNGKWDRHEPFNDANGNRNYGIGVYFIDYAFPKLSTTWVKRSGRPAITRDPSGDVQSKWPVILS
jgi:hypothetical protein